MSDTPRADLVQADLQSPEGRIASIAHGLMCRHLNQFRDEMELFAKREVLLAQIAVTKRFGTFPEAIKLQVELDKVNLAISKRVLPL